MYLEKSFYEKQKILIPQDIILEAKNPLLIPTYIALYMMAVPGTDPAYRRKITLQELCVSVKIFRKTQMRRQHYDMVIHALRYLEYKKYVTFYDFPKSTTAKFSYSFATDLRKEISANNKDNKSNFTLLSPNEMDKLLSTTIASSKSWKSTINALTLYTYLRSIYLQWQYKYCPTALPAWTGYITGLSKKLNMSSKALTIAIKTLKENDLLVPVYGLKNDCSMKTAPTIFIFKELCDGKESEVIKKCKAIANAKNEGETLRWCKAGSAPASKVAIDESSLDVICDEDEVY